MSGAPMFGIGSGVQGSGGRCESLLKPKQNRGIAVLWCLVVEWNVLGLVIECTSIEHEHA